MSDKNMQIVRRLLEEVWTQGNLSLLPELITEDAVAYPMPQFGAVHGSEGYKQFIAVYKGVFQEMNFHIEDQFSSGEKVATRWSSEVTDAAQDGAEGMEPSSGPGLLFSTLPEVFGSMPAGRLAGLAFYGALGGAAFGATEIEAPELALTIAPPPTGEGYHDRSSRPGNFEALL